ncbi:MAG: hypothetical protein WKF89_14020 [Chitinophagaceae bacterium]
MGEITDGLSLCYFHHFYFVVSMKRLRLTPSNSFTRFIEISRYSGNLWVMRFQLKARSMPALLSSCCALAEMTKNGYPVSLWVKEQKKVSRIALAERAKKVFRIALGERTKKGFPYRFGRKDKKRFPVSLWVK